MDVSDVGGQLAGHATGGSTNENAHHTGTAAGMTQPSMYGMAPYDFSSYHIDPASSWLADLDSGHSMFSGAPEQPVNWEYDPTIMPWSIEDDFEIPDPQHHSAIRSDNYLQQPSAVVKDDNPLKMGAASNDAPCNQPPEFRSEPVVPQQLGANLEAYNAFFNAEDTNFTATQAPAINVPTETQLRLCFAAVGAAQIRIDRIPPSTKFHWFGVENDDVATVDIDTFKEHVSDLVAVLAYCCKRSAPCLKLSAAKEPDFIKTQRAALKLVEDRMEREEDDIEAHDRCAIVVGAALTLHTVGVARADLALSGYSEKDIAGDHLDNDHLFTKNHYQVNHVLTFGQRMRDIRAAVRLDKNVALDVLNGTNVNDLVCNPGLYLECSVGGFSPKVGDVKQRKGTLLDKDKDGKGQQHFGNTHTSGPLSTTPIRQGVLPAQGALLSGSSSAVPGGHQNRKRTFQQITPESDLNPNKRHKKTVFGSDHIDTGE